MSKIISIGIAVPKFKHDQSDILRFMTRMYAAKEKDKRILKYLYQHSGISYRYSVLSDYSQDQENWAFYPRTENMNPFPCLEKRMQVFNKNAADLSVEAIEDCLGDRLEIKNITHLITVTCTGLSAPGLDIQLMELLGLSKNITRTSVNFMGCYAAIHAMKLAHAYCTADPCSKVLIVCTELCTLHFQQESTTDNITSSLLFGDGSAAILITGSEDTMEGFPIKGFYSEVNELARDGMSWNLSSTGFKMTLSSGLSSMIEEGFENLVLNALKIQFLSLDQVTHWCIHPGGKKILEAVGNSLYAVKEKLEISYRILREYGNMSSPTILFVLKEVLASLDKTKKEYVFGAAFGPGLTMETFVVGG